MPEEGGRRWSEVYREALQEVRASGVVTDQAKGKSYELLGHKLVIPSGRDRLLLSHPRFDMPIALGHWLWMMAGRFDYESIRYYNPNASRFTVDKIKMHGAYGPRLMGIGVNDQINLMISTIKERNDTRRAVATVYSPQFDTYRKEGEDGSEDEVPCTIALQFRPRDGLMHGFGMMRSQSAFALLPMDVFHFTLIQEYVAAATGREMGTYTHFSSSFHYYEKDVKDMVPYIASAPERDAIMPAMRSGDPSQFLMKAFALEEAIRAETNALLNHRRKWVATSYLDQAEELGDFWKLVVHALVAHGAGKLKDVELLDQLLKLAHPTLQPAIRKRMQDITHAKSLDNWDFNVREPSAGTSSTS